MSIEDGQRSATTIFIDSGSGQTWIRAHHWSARGAYSTCTFNQSGGGEAKWWIHTQRAKGAA